MVQLSLIVSVLESYEVVRRQLLHFEKFLPHECELIVVDDGSVPSLEATCGSVQKSFDFTLHFTNDLRPWTQPRGRNLGAKLARADRLLFFDIDHIVTKETLHTCLNYPGDKLHWWRRCGILDEQGDIVTARHQLIRYGFIDDDASVHQNSFMIRRKLFEELGGYDERFCGQYGGDDVDFNERYRRLCEGGLARPEEVLSEGYVFPSPANDVRRLFHSLKRTPAAR